MKLTDRTREILKYRRHARDMKKASWEPVGCSGGMLWEINRGGRQDQKILESQVSLSGKFLWVKIGYPPPQTNSR